MSFRAGVWLATAATTALVAYLFFPILRCPTQCIVDPIALAGPGLGHIALPDVHLNAWILAWVQKSLISDPLGLFDANIFYPIRDALTQSEHMIAIALWTLPLRIFSSEAVWLHQSAIIGSSLILALTTGALVRWLTASVVAGFAAGMAALWMPWRFTELAHVQLVNAQWIPLVWLYMGRIAFSPSDRRAVWLLGIALLLQLLSSFYLAYFLLLSCAALLVGLQLSARPGAAAWKRIGGAAALPLAAFLASALPYLRWSRDRGFQAVDALFDSVPPADVLALTLPDLPTGLRSLPLETSFAVPLAVAVLAVVSVLTLRSSESRQRGFVIGLLVACGFALVLALGRRLELPGGSIPLPGSLAAALVPGFENLRNPLRFAIVIGVAAPVLAGIGFARLESLARTPAARGAIGTALLLLLGLNLVTPPLPARDAWQGFAERRHAYRQLAELPHGPLIEIPWPLQPEHDAIHAGRYMLGSTLHWQPLVNGHSGYLPATYPLLRQLGQALPSVDGLARLRELIDVRWILVHEGELAPEQKRDWAAASRQAGLRLEFTTAGSSLFEVIDWQNGGRHLAALVAPGAGRKTLAGHSRAPLSAADGAGRLTIAPLGAFHFAGRRRLPKPLTLHVTNLGARTWPGLDPDPEGLVRLRYAFVGPEGEPSIRETSALAADIEPGDATLSVPVFPPARAGRYRLRVDLIQRQNGEDRALPLPAVELAVEVRAAL